MIVSKPLQYFIVLLVLVHGTIHWICILLIRKRTLVRQVRSNDRFASPGILVRQWDSIFWLRFARVCFTKSGRVYWFPRSMFLWLTRKNRRLLNRIYEKVAHWKSFFFEVERVHCLSFHPFSCRDTCILCKHWLTVFGHLRDSSFLICSSRLRQSRLPHRSPHLRQSTSHLGQIFLFFFLNSFSLSCVNLLLLLFLLYMKFCFVFGLF